MSNRFVFIACNYNMERSIARMLHSICAQSYTNWRLIITDDVSNIFSRQASHGIVSKFIDIVDPQNDTRRDPQIEFIVNSEKKWETLNVLTMIREHCEDDDIVCRIDCDDYLIDSHALFAIDRAYRETECDALWTAHRWVNPLGEVSNVNISGPITVKGSIHSVPWSMSHLKTFRKRLLNGVNEENFKNQHGEYVKRCGDQAIYLPALHRAHKKIYLPMVTYAYTCSLAPETFQTDDAKFQKEEADFIRARGFVE